MDGPALHVIDSQPLRLLVSVPCFGETQSSPAPVLCFLHGSAEAAPLEIRTALTRHGPLNRNTLPTAGGCFIIIAPQLPSPGGDVWGRYARDVRSIVRQMQTELNGDPCRTYLTGFSFGGNGVFDLALLLPDLWAALWPVDPTRVPSRDPGLPVLLSFGEIARGLKDEFIGTLGLEEWRDGYVGESLFLDQGADHTGSAALAYRDERIYSWLLSKRRSAGE